ncbi:lipase maturation factor 2-like [Haliotis asinina]|uniref:lipase maturation factor 2-like n=1 Tax=Haliotis asinina TaxID=109174 RepID=UPI00353253A7
MGDMSETRNAFLWCMSVIYLFAFSSLYVQIPGLYGDNGILPARLVLNTEANSWQELLEGQPTLLKLTPKLGLSIQSGMDLLCLGGILISFFCMVSQRMRDVVSFTLLWMLYLSLYQVGQTFLWFQWDILLLEAGFLTIIVAPFNFQLFRSRSPPQHQHDSITMWLLKWLLFRLMFASGIVKLTSQCPTWWGLTALNHHFESQCIPTPLAWYWHQFPTWFLKLSVVATFVIEIAVPFLFFAPVRSLRVVAFYAQVLLQVLIILTGNYNFFNLLTIVLCISLLDDHVLGRRKTVRRRKSFVWSSLGFVSNVIVPVLVYGYIGYYTYILFDLKVQPDYSIQSKLTFKSSDLNRWLEWVMPYTIYVGAISLAFEIFLSILRSSVEEKGFFRKNIATIQCVLFGAVAAGLFAISLVPHTVIEGKSHRSLWPAVRQWHDRLEAFQVTNSYGLFRRMTGVGGRPEVIIEGSNTKDGTWKEYEFLYKPGDISLRPPVVAPHQPRLDWQMWFAALGNYQRNAWFVNLVYRLLNNQKEVLQLLKRNPFPGKPPKYIRATLYHYYYTSSSKKNDRYSARNWWLRKKKAEYLPVMHAEDQYLKKYVKQSGILEPPPKMTTKNYVREAITWIRNLIGQPEGFTFVMSVFGSGLVVNVLNCYLF